MSMTARVLIAAVAAGVLCLAQALTSQFSEDEIAVYRAYFGTLSDGSTPLPFTAQLWDVRLFAGNGRCLSRFNIKVPSEKPVEQRTLTQDIGRGFSVEILTPEADRALADKERAQGFLDGGRHSVSEILFDPDHRYAAVGVFSSCGLTCGRGELVIFEKIDGKWQLTERGVCGQMVA